MQTILIIAGFAAVGARLLFIHFQNRKIMLTQEQALQKLADFGIQLDSIGNGIDKVGEETKSLQVEIQALKDAAANQGALTPEMETAINALASRGTSIQAKVDAVDALVPDAPPAETPPADGGTPPTEETQQ